MSASSPCHYWHSCFSHGHAIARPSATGRSASGARSPSLVRSHWLVFAAFVLALSVSAMLPIIGVTSALVIATGGVLVLLDAALSAAADARSRCLRGAWTPSENSESGNIFDAKTEYSVIGTDLTGLIDVFNPGAAKMLGLSPAAVLGSRHITDFHVESELQQRASELSVWLSAIEPNPLFRALVEGARLGRPEVRQWTYRAHDGSIVSVSVGVTRRIDAAGIPIGFAFIASDFVWSLENSRLRDDFVCMISHELRTPLSSFLGYLDLMFTAQVSAGECAFHIAPEFARFEPQPSRTSAEPCELGGCALEHVDALAKGESHQ